MIETKDIIKFSNTRTKARAYFCYLFTQNLPNRLPSVSIDTVINRMRKIQGDLRDSECVYLLDKKGFQITPTYLNNGTYIEDDLNINRTQRAYYYRAMKERRCTITDPYPSLLTKNLTVTISQPILDENGEIKFVACLDISLDAVIKIGEPKSITHMAEQISKLTYSLFSIALGIVALLLFFKAIEAFLINGINIMSIDSKNIFSATILLTLSLAIFDLIKTIFEEEVIGKTHTDKSYTIHKTMIRFLGSIIIALSIEALMLVFKFAMTDPNKIIHAIYLIAGVSLLIISLGVYIYLTAKNRGDRETS
jgi:hypothetical protein